MLTILYNKQLCSLTQKQKVIRNPSAKFGSEIKRVLASRCPQNLGNVNISSCVKRNCSASVPEAKLILFDTLGEIAPLRCFKRNYCASLRYTELLPFATRSGADLCFSANYFNCRVIRSAILVQIEKLNYSASDRYTGKCSFCLLYTSPSPRD